MKKVIVLYGPPGVGKFTVGKELVKLTNYKLFHIHLLADLIHSVFNYGTREFSDTFTDIYIRFFKKIIKSSIQGIILTLVYGVITYKGEADEKFIKDIIKYTKQNKANIYFIKLNCHEEDLYKRIRGLSRKKFDKIKRPNKLKQLLRNYPIINKNIPFIKSFFINTSNKSPYQIAKEILKLLDNINN